MIALAIFAIVATAPWTDSVRITPGHHVTIDARVTSIRVVGGDEPLVHVTAEGGAPAAVVTYENDVLVIRGSSAEPLRGTYRVDVPHEVAVRLRGATVSATVVSVATARVDVGEARVVLSDITGDVSASSILGSVNVSRIGGDADISSEGGDVSVLDVHGQASIRSVTGRIDVGSIAGEASVVSTAGDIRFHGLPSPGVEYSLDSHSGTVTIDLDPGASVTIHPTARRGAVRINGVLETVSRSLISIGRGEADMSVRTFQGSIDIITHER